jgi:pyridoxal 5'-phosphate synthase pdxT subunit
MLCQPEDGRNRRPAQHAAPLHGEKTGTACRAPTRTGGASPGLTNFEGVLGVKIGILAVQGDFAAHAARLAELGAETGEVRSVGDLDGCDGLILPGGESTTQLQFLQEEGLFNAVRKFAIDGGVIFGTCAGAILLATEVKNPAQASLGLLDMTVLRNGYGRQLASDVFFGSSKLTDAPLEMFFIRAPIIERVGPGVEVLAEHGGKPVLVQKGNLMAGTFHPELTRDTTVHRHFLQLVAARPRLPASVAP